MKVEVPVPKPYEVIKKVPYEVKVPVDKPYPVYVPKPYHVHVEKKYPGECLKFCGKRKRISIDYCLDLASPVVVEKKVPYEVKVPVDRPYKVEVEKPYPGIHFENVSN